MLKLPRKAEREYIVTSRIHAIYVAALPTEQTMVATSRDLLHSLLALRKRYSGLHITAAFWVRDRQEARLLAREAYHGFLGDDLLPLDAVAAQHRIEDAAQRLSVMLTDHEAVLQRAQAAVAFVESQIEQAQASGGLRWFNDAYRLWRLEAKAHGRGMSYAEARARLRRKIFERISGNSEQLTAAEVFPVLSNIDHSVFG